MASLAWDGALEIGIEPVDAEHRLQTTLVNTLAEQLREGMDPSHSARTLAQLADFSAIHFLSEELMMKLYAYPDRDGHKAEHRRLTEQLDTIRTHVESGGARGDVLGTIGMLQRWLVGHIESMDLAFADWCATNGIKAR